MEHLLFPFDFSDQGRQTAPFVKAIASRLPARVTLLSIAPPVWTTPPAGMVPVPVERSEESEAAFQSRVDDALKTELSGLEVRRVAAHGDPAFQIVEFARQNAVDLIMMPTHGLGVFRSLLIGSVTSKVLHDAECPVWTATHSEEEHSPKLPSTIVCAVDGSEASIGQIQWADRFSRAVGGKLSLLHVVAPISDWLALPSERELQEQVRTEARHKLEAIQNKAGVDAPLRIAVGNIAQTVTEEARQDGADLMVIGRGSVGAPLGRLRTHAYAIIHSSPCPVLSV